MSYRKITIQQAKKEFKKSDKTYKLCYVDSIPQTYLDYRPEIKEKYKDLMGLSFEEYQRIRPQYPDFHMDDIPNPDYIPGIYEYYAYFTPIPLHKQWGDDWNDAPYEHNAGEPYDDVVIETVEKDGLKFASKIEKYEIIMIPFAVNSYNWKRPLDYGIYNSPFSVDMINSGAVAWIYDNADGKIEHMTSIQAGTTIREFIDKIQRIKNMNPDYKPYDDEDD